MAKYIFSQGQVYVEEGAYAPILRKAERVMHSTVLLIVQTGNRTDTTTIQKDQRHVKSKKQKE